ncbi:MAG: indole-3-glycerol-phosphate synthase, partial [Aquiluna sp.]
ALDPAVDSLKALAPSSKMKLIAEIKRSSPSKGFLAEIPDSQALGLGYEGAGAHAISVLTEETGFSGSLEDLKKVSSAVSIPTLRKDFISNEYQILEARAAGASMVLLILAHLSESEYRDLFAFARSIGLEPLVETHSQREIQVAAESGARLIGINTRDLETFRTDIGLFESLAAELPKGCIRIAESSVTNVGDVERYRNAGADCVLVGEALVTGDWKSLIPQFISVS